MGPVFLLYLAAATAASQPAANPAPELPKEPAALLQAAQPHYSFNSEMKPFHLRATYQLYDQSGAPSETGTYEYWWASPDVNRSTWTRARGTQSDWHTADGKRAYQRTGDSLKFFEYRLQSALFSPMPDERDLDISRSRLDRQPLDLGKAKLSCVEVIPNMPFHGRLQTVPLGLFPTYCFDSKVPALRVSYAWGTLTTAYDKIAVWQNRYLARSIEMLEGKKKLLTAEVVDLTGMTADDPALTPPTDATVASGKGQVGVSAGLVQGMIVNKVIPVYPQDAKDAHVDGTVVLEAIIGMDGGVHDLRVASTPWPSLASSALWSVSHWQYKPYLVDGKPVEVRTTINVIFSLRQ